jgi:hypothetical protein
MRPIDNCLEKKCKQKMQQTFPEDLTPRIIHKPTIIQAANNARALYN